MLAGLLDGLVHDVDEVLALDATSLLVAEYLAVRHEGDPGRARSEYGLAAQVVREWFPVRALAIDVVIDAADPVDIDGLATLALAHSLRVPLVTTNRDLASREIAVLHC